jgi:hypothetical protein
MTAALLISRPAILLPLLHENVSLSSFASPPKAVPHRALDEPGRPRRYRASRPVRLTAAVFSGLAVGRVPALILHATP